MTVEELQVLITANTAGVRSEVDKVKSKISEFGKSAEKATSDMQKSFGKVNKVVAGVAVGIGVAIAGVAVKAVAFTEDFHKALNGLQASTGATDSEMKGFKETMVSLYNQNYGENFEEIAEAMKEVKVQTGLSGKALEDMTKKAFILKDTFGFEIKESVTSATAMMKQFGITGDEAYNLMAQGAQQGLDKNGDMLDTINEYSGSFKAAGFSAEEMMNMLSNGAKSGAFSVDKLGDAMKEFGIRSKDGSKGTSDAFKALGLDSNQLTKDFGAGGEAGKKAFQQVNEKLLAMKDPVKQNALGVALYGTQWEDLGVKGITALTKTKGGIDNVKDAMKGIEKIKYNTFSEGLKGIGRIIQTSVLLPIGEKLFPKLQEFSQYIIDNMPMIKQKIDEAFVTLGPIIDKVVAGVKKFIDIFILVAGFISEHQVAFTNIAIVIASVVVAFNLVTGVLAIVSGAVTAFGIVLAFVTSPIGIVILVIAAVIAIGVLLWKNWDTIKAKAIELATNLVLKFEAIKQGIGEKVASIKTAVVNKFIEIKTAVVQKVTDIKTAITQKASDIKTSVVNKFNEIKSGASTAFNNVKNAVMTPINDLKSKVSNVVNSIKGFFTNLHITIPHIKMPHFSINGSFSLAPPRIPSLGVNWYQNGGIFDKASVIGLGENGSEAVVPLERNLGWVDKMASKITDKMGNGGNDLNLTITNFVNNRSQDVQSLAEELQFYMRQKGGNQ